MSAMGKPVAFDASAEERDVRGLISMMTTRPSFGLRANWTFVPPMTPILQIFLDRRGNGHHRRRAEAVARVDADGIDVFDEAHGNHRSRRVADDFDFELFPAENGFLDEALMRHRSLQPARDDRFEFVQIVDEPAAGAAHRVSGAHDQRKPEPLGNLHRFVDGVGDVAARHVDADFRHRFLEDEAVFAALDRVEIHADDPDAVFFQNAFLVQLDGEVQPRLPAEVRQKRVRALLRDNLLEAFFVERFDVGDVGDRGIGHDRRRIRVHENDLVAALAQRLARLRSRVVELAGLTDHDRSRPDNHHFFDVVAFGHDFLRLKE